MLVEEWNGVLWSSTKRDLLGADDNGLEEFLAWQVGEITRGLRDGMERPCGHWRVYRGSVGWVAVEWGMECEASGIRH